jgi:2,5-furandicarboxylate decarboxylase 1
MRDLRSFLDAHVAATWRLDGAVSAQHELTALQHELDARGRYPILFSRHVPAVRGGEACAAVVTNLSASRELMASALGIRDHRETARWFAERTQSGIDPVVVPRAAAPVQQLVEQGESADLTSLPVLTQHELEPGPYLTAAHATTFDPESGVDNTAIQRCWVQAPRRMTWYPYPASHNARNLRKFWRRGEPCPLAFWIGHHPAVLLGTQAKLRYPESHWRAAGGVIGEPLRLVASITHGGRVLVPADAEIVIEGWAHPDATTHDGPFGEYTGYLGPAAEAPIVEVSCITRRADAIYHDYGSGLTDMLVPDNMAMEGKLFGLAKAVAPSLENVHVPASGRRFHAWLQLREPAGGEARDALVAALSYRRVKTVVAVDSDVDIFSTEAMLWALATRVQWSRDAIVIDGLSGSSLDPSLPPGTDRASKMGVDATLPPRSGPAPPPPVSTVPPHSLARARAFLQGTDDDAWPRM